MGASYWDVEQTTDEEGRDLLRAASVSRLAGGIQDLLPIVVQALRPRISEGEGEDVKSSIPKGLASVIPWYSSRSP